MDMEVTVEQSSPGRNMSSDIKPKRRNAKRARLNDDIGDELAVLLEEAKIQVPRKDIFCKRNEVYHIKGHWILESKEWLLWKITNSDRMEILQNFKEGLITVHRGPPDPSELHNSDQSDNATVHHNTDPFDSSDADTSQTKSKPMSTSPRRGTSLVTEVPRMETPSNNFQDRLRDVEQFYNRAMTQNDEFRLRILELERKNKLLEAEKSQKSHRCSCQTPSAEVIRLRKDLEQATIQLDKERKERKAWQVLYETSQIK